MTSEPQTGRDTLIREIDTAKERLAESEPDFEVERVARLRELPDGEIFRYEPAYPGCATRP